MILFIRNIQKVHINCIITLRENQTRSFKPNHKDHHEVFDLNNISVISEFQ